MVRMIVDSSADLLPEIAQQVRVVPLSIHFGETEYRQGIDITNAEFYEKLVESDALPTTSQATPFAFGEVFAEVAAAGDTAVVITIASALSGTYQSACLAAADYPGKIFVVDSQNVALGSSILVQYALELAKQGASAEEIAATLERERSNVRLIALLDTLEYLKKGGRISKTVAFAGGLLSIKPVICIEEGAIKLIGKARGSKQGNNLLVQEIDKAGGIDFSRPLLLGYTGLSDALLQKYIVDSAPLWEGNCEKLPTALVGSVVGTHVGPGAVAVAFFSKQHA